MHFGRYPYSWSKVVEMWYNESKYFTYGEWPSSDDGFETSHYTQVIYNLSDTNISGYICGSKISTGSSLRLRKMTLEIRTIQLPERDLNNENTTHCATAGRRRQVPADLWWLRKRQCQPYACLHMSHAK